MMQAATVWLPCANLTPLSAVSGAQRDTVPVAPPDDDARQRPRDPGLFLRRQKLSRSISARCADFGPSSYEAGSRAVPPGHAVADGGHIGLRLMGQAVSLRRRCSVPNSSP